MIKFTNIVESVSKATSGTFVGITDYISQNGDISSVTGHIGCSYEAAKLKNIQLLETALDTNDFEDITVSGECYWDDEKNEWNARKRSKQLKPFDITFSKDEVIECAKQLLQAWKNPTKKSRNKIQLTEKENGLYLEENTGNYNMVLLVEHQTYKGTIGEPKKKVSAPYTILKNIIRKRFERKLKAFTIGKDCFSKLSIAGLSYTDADIVFD